MAKWVMRKAKDTAAARAGADRASSIFRLVLVASLLGVFTDCGHKGTPLFKDRLRPSLKKVASLNNRQILFTFSEAIDIRSLKPGDITIMADSQALPIITFYPSLSNAEIVCVTGPQTAVVYEVSGVVYDSSENKGVFRTRITGSLRPDTVLPFAKSYSQGARKNTVIIQFDKAMDTTSIGVIVLPKRTFHPVWLNLQTVNLIPRDSMDALRNDTTYYFLIRDGRDLSGNQFLPFVTRITPDTAYQPIYLRGKVRYLDTLSADGWVIISRDRPVGVARIDRGEFLFEVRDSLAFFADAIRGDLHGRAEVRAGQENLIDLKLEKFDIDSLFN
jgi:hypothetical protein